MVAWFLSLLSFWGMCALIGLVIGLLQMVPVNKDKS